MLRPLLISALALLAALLFVPAAGAADLAPADGVTYQATDVEGIPFAVTGGPRLAPVHVVVARTPALGVQDTVDFVGLSAVLGEPGSYRGLGAVGTWAAQPGTYFWQARSGTAPRSNACSVVISLAISGLTAVS